MEKESEKEREREEERERERERDRERDRPRESETKTSEGKFDTKRVILSNFPALRTTGGLQPRPGPDSLSLRGPSTIWGES